MKQALLWLIVILAFASLLAVAAARADDARTDRLYAQAHLVGAQSSARQDALASMMPYAVLGLATIGGVIAVVALVAGVVAIAVIWSKQTAEPPIHMIETRTVLVLQPGQHSRREVFKLLSERITKL